MTKEKILGNVELIAQIKQLLIDQIYNSGKHLTVNYSDFLTEKLNYHYTYMANTFSKLEGMSIRQFIIETRIKRAKELLIAGELTLTEISFKLYYSSVGALSNQFKKVTGINPSTFLRNWDEEQRVKDKLNAFQPSGPISPPNINVN